MGSASTPTNLDAHDDDGVSEFVSESEWQPDRPSAVGAPHPQAATTAPVVPIKAAAAHAAATNAPAVSPAVSSSVASSALAATVAPPLASGPAGAAGPAGAVGLVGPVGPVGIVGLVGGRDLSSEPHPESSTDLPVAATSRPDLTFAEILDAASPLTWHEAVAFVREYLLSTPERALCDPSSTLLTPSGDVLAQPGAVAVTHPARAAAELLVKVLPPDTPPALTGLAKEDAGPTPRRRSASELAKALAFFERPNRRADLAALWARADAAIADRRSARAMARIRREIAQPVVAPPVVATNRGWLSWRDIWAQNYALGAALCGILAVGSSAWLLVSLSGGVREPQRLASRPLSRLVVGFPALPLRARIGPMPATVEPEPPPAGVDATSSSPASNPDPPPADVPTTVAEAPPTAVPTAGGNDKPAGTDAWVVTMRELVPTTGRQAAPPTPAPPAGQAAKPIVPPTRRAANARTAAVGRIYTSLDADVRPAALQWPPMQLDVVRGAQADVASVLRLTIDEEGRVERVRLLSPGNSFSDRMFLSAAKAWVFHPARLADKPVRYQLDIRLKREP